MPMFEFIRFYSAILKNCVGYETRIKIRFKLTFCLSVLSRQQFTVFICIILQTIIPLYFSRSRGRRSMGYQQRGTAVSPIHAFSQQETRSAKAEWKTGVTGTRLGTPLKRHRLYLQIEMWCWDSESEIEKALWKRVVIERSLSVYRICS